jgi:hypothetical protein
VLRSIRWRLCLLVAAGLDRYPRACGRVVCGRLGGCQLSYFIQCAIGSLVSWGHRLARNPAADATPPSAKEAKAPEMHPWNAAQLAAFLAWSEENSTHHALWYVLAYTGMRRGEALALRWRDVNLDAGTVSVRRSAGVVRVKGEGAEIAEGPTKTGKPRVVDLDAAAVAALRTFRRARGGMALQLGRDDALVFGDHEGRHLHPERVSRTFKLTAERCRKALGDGAPPEIRLHDLGHTHATLLQVSRIAFDASFGSSCEHALPAAQRAALRRPRPARAPRGYGDLGLHGPPGPNATMMRLMPLHGVHHRCACWHRDASRSSRLHPVPHRRPRPAVSGRHRSCEGRAGLGHIMCLSWQPAALVAPGPSRAPETDVTATASSPVSYTHADAPPWRGRGPLASQPSAAGRT